MDQIMRLVIPAGIKSYHIYDIKFPHKSHFPQTATLDSREL